MDTYTTYINIYALDRLFSTYTYYAHKHIDDIKKQNEEGKFIAIIIYGCIPFS